MSASFSDSIIEITTSTKQLTNKYTITDLFDRWDELFFYSFFYEDPPPTKLPQFVESYVWITVLVV